MVELLLWKVQVILLVYKTIRRWQLCLLPMRVVKEMLGRAESGEGTMMMRTWEMVCHDPSHGGFYMAEGTLYIRIGLPPRVVSGDRLVSSRCGLTAHYLYCCRAYPMSRDWGCTSTYYRSSYVPILVYAALGAIPTLTCTSTSTVARIS